MFGGNWSDALALIGATLKDASPGSSGDNIMNAQKLISGRQQQATKDAFAGKLQGLIGGQYQDGPAPTVSAPTLAPAAAPAPADLGTTNMGLPQVQSTSQPYQYQAPQKTAPVGIGDPRWLALAAQAQAAGYKMDDVLEVLKAQQPHVQVGPDGTTYNDKDTGALGRTFANRSNVSGTIVNLNDPNNENRVISEAPVKGAMPVYDNRGHVTDWSLPGGAQGAIGAAARAQQTGQTFGTVFNRPNGDGSTTPTMGSDMFGAGGGSGGASGGGGAGRTLNPGEAEAQKVDYTNGAQTIAGAGDAKIKAANTSQQYVQAFNDASALDTNNLSNFKLGTAKILRSIGIQNPDLENFTNTAEGYRMLTTQMVLPLAKELGSNPSNRDAKIIQDAMPGLKTPRQTAMVTFASQAALQNKEAARQEFFANYSGPQSKASMQRAWSDSEAAKRSVFQDPIFQRLQIEGKPAVTIFPQPYKDGKRYGIFRPGTPFEQIFEVH